MHIIAFELSDHTVVNPADLLPGAPLPSSYSHHMSVMAFHGPETNMINSLLFYWLNFPFFISICTCFSCHLYSVSKGMCASWIILQLYFDSRITQWFYVQFGMVPNKQFEATTQILTVYGMSKVAKNLFHTSSLSRRTWNFPNLDFIPSACWLFILFHILNVSTMYVIHNQLLLRGTIYKQTSQFYNSEKIKVEIT